MNYNKIFKIILSFIFLVISLFNFKNYIDYKNEKIENKKIISYEFVNKKDNKSGRGSSYDMVVKYKDKLHTISITSNEYDMIDNGKLPKLYYLENSKELFSDWTIKLKLRITVLFFSLFLASFIWGLLSR